MENKQTYDSSWVRSGKTDAPGIREQLRSVPEEPGCYLWKDRNGAILYVGKAIDLRARMTQYVTGQDEREKIPLMMEQVASFDYIVVTNETESLVLEKNLIQQYHPPFNVDYRDNKSYPYIAITEGALYPGIKYTREKHKSSTRYFGPYTDARAARETIDTVRRIVPICSCSCAEYRKLCRNLEHGKWPKPDDKACFEYHIGKGAGPCCAAITPEAYKEYVARVERFLSGHRDEFVNELTSEMNRAAAELDFEHAARVRDRLAAITALQEKQKAVLPRPINIDVVGFFREETIASAHVFVVREGRVIISNDFILDKGMNVPQADLVGQFLKQVLRLHAGASARGGHRRDAARGRRAPARELADAASRERARRQSARRGAPARREASTCSRWRRSTPSTPSCDTRCARATTRSAPTSRCCSSKARSRCPSRPCASSALTSRPSTATTRSPRWSCSPPGAPTNRSTAASRFARPTARQTTSP